LAVLIDEQKTMKHQVTSYLNYPNKKSTDILIIKTWEI